MVTIEGTASLGLVKAQLDEAISIAEANLEHYAEEPDNETRLKTSLDQINQIRGVLKLIGLGGAALLAEEMLGLGGQIMNDRVADKERALACMSSSIMMLSRYIEYVETQSNALPVLLIPAINDIRAHARKSLLQESHFNDTSFEPERPQRTQTEPADPQKLMSNIRRLRQMYQVGMLSVFRDEPIDIGVKLMRRALDRIDSLGGDVPMSKLWWLSTGVMDALSARQLEPNNARKSFLGSVDRQIKSVIAGGEQALQEEPKSSVVREAIFLTSLVDPVTDTLKEIRETFGLVDESIRDGMLRQERENMRGPGGSVLRSVADALQEELTSIKDSLDLGARGAADDEESFKKISDSLIKVSNTLQVLGLKDASDLIESKAKNVSGWTSEDVDAESEEFNEVADALLFVENSIANLLPDAGPMPSEEDVAGARQAGMSITQISGARGVVVSEARSGLSLAKRAITSYIDSNWDVMHLANVPKTLSSVWGGLVFLKLPRAAAVLRSCEHFIDKKLLEENIQPDQSTLETLADALTSVDYFLESMETSKPLGDSILDVAQASVKELGFPVEAA